MATGRDIHGKVVMDATVDVSPAEAKLGAFFDQVFEIKTKINLPSKATLQTQLDALTKGVVANVKVNLNVDQKDLAKAQASVDAAQAKVTQTQRIENDKRITDNVRAANKTKAVADKLAADQIRLAEQGAAARSVIETQLDAELKKLQADYYDFQKREAVKAAANEAALANERKKLQAQIQTAVTKSEVAMTAFEIKELEKRLTAAENEAEKRATIHDRALAAQELAEARYNHRLDILSEQHYNRVNAQEQASALRREVINAQLQARLTAQDDAFNKRREFAAEAEQRKLQAAASKPILQKILVDSNAINSSLADFDRTITRALTASLLAFTVWSAGVEAATASAAVAGVAAFAKLQIAATRAATVVASDKYSNEVLKNGHAISNFADVSDAASKRIIAASQQVALATIGFDPTAVTEGVQSLLQAGEKLPEALKNIGPAAKFAQVNQADLKETTDGLAASLASAGLGSKDAALLLDKFSFTAQSALGNSADYLEAFSNRAGASFRAYGRGVNETLTLLELLGNTGVVGKEAGTQAFIVLRDIAKAAGKSPEAFQKYGIAIRDSAHLNTKFSTTLVDLAKNFQRIQKQQGDVGVFRFGKELGLTQKSIGSLLQIIPQVTTQGQKGLDNFNKQLDESGGNVERQVTQQRKTIAAQFDNLKDTFTVVASTFGAGAEKQVTRFFDIFAGTGGKVSQATGTINKFGVAFGVLVGKLADFVQTDAFTNGVKTLLGAITDTLHGVDAAVAAFGEAFRGTDKGLTTFEAFANAVRAFAQLSATVLPIVAGAIGKTVKFLIDHRNAFETFAKITLAVYAARKAFTLFINPVLVASNAISKFLKTSEALAAAETIGPVRSAILSIATNLGLVKVQADLATKSLRGVAAAEGLVDVANAPGLGSLGGRATRGAGQIGTRIGNTAASDAIAGSQIGRSARVGKGLDSAIDGARAGAGLEAIAVDSKAAAGGLQAFIAGASRATLVTAALYAAFEVGIGVFKGLSDSISKSLHIDPAFEDGVKQLGKAFSGLNHILQGFGTTIGQVLGKTVADSVGGLDALVRSLNGGKGDRDNLGKHLRGLVEDLAILNPSTSQQALQERRLRLETEKAAAATEAHRRAVEKQRAALDHALNTTITYDSATGKFTRTTAHAVGGFTLFGSTVGSISKTIKSDLSSVAASANSVLTAILRKTAAGRAQLAQATRDNLVLQATIATGGRLDASAQGAVAAGVDPKTGLLTNRNPLIAKANKLIAKQRAAAAAALASVTTPDTGGPLPPAGSGTAAAPVHKEFTSPNEAIQLAIDKLKPAQKAAQIEKVVGDVTKKAGDAFLLTRNQTLLLADAMPQLEKTITKSQSAVDKLNTSLEALRNTQLKGTQAFSDQQFANDQQQKQLQLDRINALAVPGTTDQSPQIVAIDKQLTDLQTAAQKLDLQQSLQFDPLKRKLDQTFAPVKEDTFGNIIAQFNTLTAQQKAAQDQLTTQTSQRDKLNDALQRSQDHYQGLDDVAQRSVDAFNKAQDAAAKTATALGAVGSSAAAGTTAVKHYSKAVTDVPTGAGVVDKSLKGIADRVEALSGQFSASGVRIVTLLTQGINRGAVNILEPGLAKVMGDVNLLVHSSDPVANAAGVALMDGFLSGIKQGFGTPKDIGSVAWYLNVFIPQWIRENKGPVAADAQILVPAGNAVMEGFGKGLRSGFSGIQGFIKEVGPSLSEFISGDAFSKRTATIMADIAIGKTPDIASALGDLEIGAVPGLGGIMGPIDPSLSFLHKTESLADTTQMAQKLAQLFGLIVTATTNGKHAAGSDHYKGWAADLSNSSGGGDDPRANTPQMLALANALKPLQGGIIKQLIYQNHDLLTGAFIPGHQNHDHVAFNPGRGFAEFSGKIGKSLPFSPLAVAGLTQGPAQTFRAAGEPLGIAQVISRAALASGVNVKLLTALTKAESGFNPRAGSPAGAYGLTQLLRGTAASLGVTDIFDPFQNELGGAKYLKAQLDRFHDVRLALAAYNAGPAAVERYKGIPPYPETQDYVRKILGFMKSFGGFRELGGPTHTGKSYVVGERGPEIFTPSRNGTIIPNDETQRILGGGTQYHDNRQITVTTGASDPAVIVDYMDKKTKAKFVGVNTR